MYSESEIQSYGIKGAKFINSRAELIFETPFVISKTHIITKVKCRFGAYSLFRGGRVSSLSSIGRFCSIGPGLTCGDGNHPLEMLSTHQFQYNGSLFDFWDEFKNEKCTKRLSKDDVVTEPPIIGNDVWVGANVTILRGVKVGDGAVLAAGAVVVNDVEPYSIVGGVPAKHIKYRFASREIRQRLVELRWWELTLPQLNLLGIDYRNVEKSIDNISDFKSNNELGKYRSVVLLKGKVLSN